MKFQHKNRRKDKKNKKMCLSEKAIFSQLGLSLAGKRFTRNIKYTAVRIYSFDTVQCTHR